MKHILFFIAFAFSLSVEVHAEEFLGILMRRMQLVQFSAYGRDLSNMAQRDHPHTPSKQYVLLVASGRR